MGGRARVCERERREGKNMREWEEEKEYERVGGRKRIGECGRKEII